MARPTTENDSRPRWTSPWQRARGCYAGSRAVQGTRWATTDFSNIREAPSCRSGYTVQLPIKARKQFLQFDSSAPTGKPVTKEAEIPDALHILNL
jgi:hypothetical protein